MGKKGQWRALAAATATSVAGVTGAGEHPLQGYWVYEKRGFMSEYTIEAVHEDGQVEGVYCMRTLSKGVWGMRFDGYAKITSPKMGMEFEAEAMWLVATMTRKGNLESLWLETEGKSGAVTFQATHRRSNKQRCGHRFPKRGATEALENDGEVWITGQWGRRMRKSGTVEIAIERTAGNSVQGRACWGGTQGDAKIIDIHKGAASEPMYDEQLQSLTIIELRNNGAERVEHTFGKMDKWKLRQTIKRQTHGKQDDGWEALTRNTGPQGCLAHTSARVHSLAGTWRTKTKNSGNTAIRISRDRGGNDIEGLLCKGHKGGKVDVTTFAAQDAEGQKTVSARGQTVEIRAGEATRHVLEADPAKSNVLSYHQAAMGEEGAERSTLRRTKKKTCATGLTARRQEAPVLPLLSAREPMIGEWSGVNRANGTVTEVRIERIKRGQRPVGVICERTGPNTFVKWDLNHRRIKARKEADTIIRWSRKPKTHTVETDTLHGLELTEISGKPMLSHITQVEGRWRATTSLRRGRTEGGCLAHIARQADGRR